MTGTTKPAVEALLGFLASAVDKMIGEEPEMMLSDMSAIVSLLKKAEVVMKNHACVKEMLDKAKQAQSSLKMAEDNKRLLAAAEAYRASEDLQAFAEVWNSSDTVGGEQIEEIKVALSAVSDRMLDIVLDSVQQGCIANTATGARDPASCRDILVVAKEVNEAMP